MTDINRYKRHSSNKINYSNSTITDDEIRIPPTTILFENSIVEKKPKVNSNRDLPYFFEIEGADFQFDIFGVVFYLLTRYEEYNQSNLDEHGRYQSNESLAVQNEFVQMPLVDLWIKKLGELLQQKFSDIELPSRNYFYQPTVDVDMAWSYRNKGFTRNTGGFIKDLIKLNLPKASKRAKVLIGNGKDPFDQFDFLKNLHLQKKQSLLHFFLVAKHGVYDKNISIENTDFQNLIKNISNDNPVGLHPSYQSNENEEILKNEKSSLEKIIGKTINKSRQHFLKLDIPNTYQQLIELGIKEDYTMGYPDVIGFRASTAIPYHWFDLKKNKVTDLIIYPFQVMDVTLKKYLGLSPQEAVEKSKFIIDQCKAVKGTFITIWHNSSFDTEEGWEDWDKVYQQIVDYAS